MYNVLYSGMCVSLGEVTVNCKLWSFIASYNVCMGLWVLGESIATAVLTTTSCSLGLYPSVIVL